MFKISNGLLGKNRHEEDCVGKLTAEGWYDEMIERYGHAEILYNGVRISLADLKVLPDA